MTRTTPPAPCDTVRAVQRHQVAAERAARAVHAATEFRVVVERERTARHHQLQTVTAQQASPTGQPGGANGGGSQPDRPLTTLRSTPTTCDAHPTSQGPEPHHAERGPTALHRHDTDRAAGPGGDHHPAPHGVPTGPARRGTDERGSATAQPGGTGALGPATLAGAHIGRAPAATPSGAAAKAAPDRPPTQLPTARDGDRHVAGGATRSSPAPDSLAIHVPGVVRLEATAQPAGLHIATTVLGSCSDTALANLQRALESLGVSWATRRAQPDDAGSQPRALSPSRTGEPPTPVSSRPLNHGEGDDDQRV